MMSVGPEQGHRFHAWERKLAKPESLPANTGSSTEWPAGWAATPGCGQHGDPLGLRLHRDVHVAATGQLLRRRQPELLQHRLIPGVPVVWGVTATGEVARAATRAPVSAAALVGRSAP